MTSTKQSRFIFLDYMRIFAFISVLIGHKFYRELAAAATNPDLHITIRYFLEGLLPLCMGGAAGVVVFFLTSGYIITHVLQNETTTEFIVKRIFRIYPLYIFAVLVEQVMGYWVNDTPLLPLWQLILRLLLVGDFFDIPNGLGSVEWTLRIEVLFYAFMVALKWRGLFKHQQFLPSLYLAMSIALFALPAFPSAGHLSAGYVNTYTLFLFIGSTIYLIKNKLSPPNASTLIAITLFLLFLVKLTNVNPNWKETNYALFAVLIFLAGMHFENKLTNGKSLRLISNLTFSIYLFHNWLWTYIRTSINEFGLTGFSGKIVTLVTVLSICLLLHKTIETYGLRLGRLVLKKIKTREIKPSLNMHKPHATPHQKLVISATLLGFCLLFYICSYYSVSDLLPSSIPIHHDDYTNYSAGGNPLAVSWIRPFSTAVIFWLDRVDPILLTWAIRLLTVTYAILCWQLLSQLSEFKNRNLETLVFASCVFSTPVIVEYARYTGLITHLLSGTFGIVATLLLVKGSVSGQKKPLLLSAPAIIISVLAKEDFILLYLYSAVACAIQFKDTRRFNLKVSVSVSILSVLIIGLEKFLDASSFLGDSNIQSSYYMSASPLSILNTAYRYLRGADHPALASHGLVTLSLFIISTIIAVGISITQKRISLSLYGIGAILAVMAPYSVLPNHINAYYEFIWMPLLIGTFIFAVREAVSLIHNPILMRSIGLLVITGASVLINCIDFKGRQSIAHWYDAIATDNRQVLQTLESNRDKIAASTSTCIISASLFSPWYMHNGSYLRNNLNLHSSWIILTSPGSPEYSGFSMSAAIPRSGISTVASEEEFPKDCVIIDLKRS